MHIITLAFILIWTLSSFSCGGPTDELESINKGEEIVKVNRHSIRQGFLDLLKGINPRVEEQLNNPLTRKRLIDNLVEQELLYQESIKRGLHKKDDVIHKAALYKKVIISQALLDNELESKAKDYYEKNKEGEFTRIALSHIQINFKKDDTAATEAEKKAALKKSQDIRDRLIKGGDFAQIAKDESDDKATARKGGDMGEISRGDKRLERRALGGLGEVAFKLKKDELSEPFESPKAYHLIKVTSEPSIVPFDEAKKIVFFKMQKEVKDELVATLKKDATVAYAEKGKDAVVPEDQQKPPQAGAEQLPEGAENPPQKAPDSPEPQVAPTQPLKEEVKDSSGADTSDKVHYKPGTVKFEKE